MSLDDIIKTNKKAIPKHGKKAAAALLSAKKPRTDKKGTAGKIIGATKLKTKRLGARPSSSSTSSPKVIVDARNKIIQRNRSKITDARDKLAQITKQSGDVRLKLIRKMELSRKQPAPIGRAAEPFLPGRHMKKRSGPYLEDSIGGFHSRRSAQPAPVHRMDYDDLDLDVDMDFVPATVALRRTVQNEMAYSSSKMPPLPTFQRSVAISDYHRPQSPPSYAHHHRLIRNASPPAPAPSSAANWQSDPFDCYEVPMSRPLDVSEPKNLQRQIRNTSAADLMPTKGILRYSREARGSPPPPPPEFAASHRNVSSGYHQQQQQRHPHHHHPHHHQSYNHNLDDTHLSYEMRHRLERAPDVTTSMGIFSNPYTVVNKPVQQSAAASGTPPTSGYRIVVSNLHNSVSQSDIRELFEDIGELVEARLVRPGVAEVIFRTMKDAELAVDTYHNRQLDGQPMKCLLVNPRASSKPTAPAIKTARR